MHVAKQMEVAHMEGALGKTNVGGGLLWDSAVYWDHRIYVYNGCCGGGWCR
jgi:hypothetical protein